MLVFYSWQISAAAAAYIVHIFVNVKFVFRWHSIVAVRGDRREIFNGQFE